jgi:ribosome-binding factor A
MAKVDRITRVNEILKREIADILERINVCPAPNTLVSVTAVKAAPDLRNAQVYISVFGGKDYQMRDVIEKLNHMRHDIQRAVSSVVVLKYTPVLEFRLDRKIEYGDKVISLLEELENAKAEK